MQIAKLFFIIISAATLAGNASAELTPLHKAARDNNVAAATLLIKSRADVNAKDGGGYTPLHWAAVKIAGAEVAKLLIDNGAAVKAKDKNGRTPLHLASLKNAAAVAKLLIYHGAAVNAKDNDGATPLHSAAFGTAATGAKMLIANGADVNAKNNDGATPLDTAKRKSATDLKPAERKNLAEVVKLLIANGATDEPAPAPAPDIPLPD